MDQHYIVTKLKCMIQINQQLKSVTFTAAQSSRYVRADSASPVRSTNDPLRYDALKTLDPTRHPARPGGRLYAITRFHHARSRVQRITRINNAFRSLSPGAYVCVGVRAGGQGHVAKYNKKRRNKTCGAGRCTKRVEK